MATENQIASAFLRALGAPDNAAMRTAVRAWLRQESGRRIIGNNPWNISYAAAQGVASRGGPKPTSYRVHSITGQKFAVYANTDDGARASALLLTQAGKDWRGYDKVVKAARAGDPVGFLNAIARSAWDAGRYGTKDGGTNKLLGVFKSLGGTVSGAGSDVGTKTASLSEIVKLVFGSAFKVSQNFTNAHDGIDLSAPRGTPVYAARDGIVEYARNAGSDPSAGKAWAIGGGNVVNVNIGGDKVTQYAHLDTIAVKSGAKVKKGQLIGTVGATGKATGPHLHFGVWDKSKGVMVNPVPYLMSSTTITDAPMLAGWTNDKGPAVNLPVGHVLTADDVDAIMEKLKANGWFAGDVNGTAENYTRAILTAHIGDKWNKELQTQLVGELTVTGGEAQNLILQNLGASAADVAKVVTDPLVALGDLAGTLLDPGNWIRILALGVGLAMAGYGTINVLKASGAPMPSVPYPPVASV